MAHQSLFGTLGMHEKLEWNRMMKYQGLLKGNIVPTAGLPARKPHVLIATGLPEDSQKIRLALMGEGWTFEVADSWDHLVNLAEGAAFDVAILGPRLTGERELELLMRVRDSGSLFPVLMVVEEATDERGVPGLTVGGDAALLTPYSIEGMLAQLRKLIRHSTGESGVVQFGPLTLDEDLHLVELNGDEIPVTATEFDILRFFMMHPDRVYSKRHLLDRVWPHEFAGKSTVVELYVSYVRKKVNQVDFSPLQTIRGAGYIFKLPRKR